MRNGESEPQNPREAVGGVSGRDLETIAAFIDRRLSAEERRAFMRRLDTEEELYEVFVETVRYRDQSAAGQAEVAEHPSSSRRWPLLAAAAAIVVVAVTPVVLLNLPAGRYSLSILVRLPSLSKLLVVRVTRSVLPSASLSVSRVKVNELPLAS